MNSFKKIFKSIAYSWNLFYKSSRLVIILYYVLNLFSASINLFEAYAIKEILNALVADEIQMSKLYLWGALLVASIALGYVNSSVVNYMNAKMIKKAEHQFEVQLLEKTRVLPFSFIDSSDGRDMLDRVDSLKFTAINFCMRLINMLTSLYKFVVAFIFMANFNIWFSLIFIGLTVPGVVLNVIFEKKAEDLWWERFPDIRRMSYYRWMLTDPMPAKDVRTYNLTDSIRSRYFEEKNDFVEEKKSLQKRRTVSVMAAALLRYGGIAVFTAYAVIKAISGDFSIGDISLYSSYAVSCSSAFASSLSIYLMIHQYATEYMDTFFEFFEIEPEFYGGNLPLDKFESIEFDNVCFKYPTGKKPILNGVSFSLKRGEKLSIVGINGSGKTTIIKLMLGFYKADSGKILINEIPIEQYKIEDVRRQFSALFQDFVQYPLQLRYNVAFSDLERAENDEEIIAALKQSGLYEELEPKLNNGLDSYMKRRFDDNGTELSKGQWQKLSLARTYFKNAPVLIFDEPSASLDAEAEDRIFKNFEAISEGKTGVMISHRISAARMATKIIVLDGGVIAEQGTHSELVELGGLYSEMYRLQREKYSVQEDQV